MHSRGLGGGFEYRRQLGTSAKIKVGGVRTCYSPITIHRRKIKLSDGCENLTSILFQGTITPAIKLKN